MEHVFDRRPACEPDRSGSRANRICQRGGHSRSSSKGGGIPQGKRSDLRGEGVQRSPGARSQERRGVCESRSDCVLSARLSEGCTILAQGSGDRSVFSENGGCAGNLRKKTGGFIRSRAVGKIVSQTERQADAPAS